MKRLFSRFTKREVALFAATASIIAGLGAYILLVEPSYKEWNKLEGKFEAANARLLKNLRLLADKEIIEKEYEQYKDYFQKTDKDEEEMATILKEIETAASNAGVKITSIKPKGAKQLKNYKKFSIEVVSEAKITQFLKFIYDLEGSKRLLKVERLVLSLKGSQSDLLKATLIIRKISF